MKKYLLLSFLIFLLFTVNNASAMIKINEIFFDPIGTDTGHEWIELYNDTNESVDISGYELNATSGDYFQFPTNTIMPAHNFLLVWWRKDGSNTNNEFFTGTNGYNTNLGNSYGWIALFNSSEHNKNSLIDYIEYGKAGLTWEPAAADAKIWQKGDFINISKTEGVSLARKLDGVDTDNSSDWQEYTSPTPNNSNNNLLPTSMPTVTFTPIPTPTPTITPASTPMLTLTPSLTPTWSPTPNYILTPTPASTSIITNTPTPINTAQPILNPQLIITPISNSTLNSNHLSPNTQKNAQQYITNSPNVSQNTNSVINDHNVIIPKNISPKETKIQQKFLANSLIFKPISAIINIIKSIINFTVKLLT